jgi:hypothetical protein
VIQNLILHGTEATIVWGYRPAVVLRAWRIAKVERGAWILSAQLARADAFQARQKPLLFTAPRMGKNGFWAFPVKTLDVGPNRIRATLEPPVY